ncbi:MAG: hypothetical protein PHW62_06290 [Candidatus Ratteibacteria bacterium]|nr:hypothetical protein [Candidatus Ratteibacteria bacterium]
MSKGKKVLKVIGIIFGSLIALIIVLNIVLNIVFGIQLRNKLAELKAQGKPMTIAEIVPPPVPDEENAALIYKKVFALLETEEIKQTTKIIGELKSFSDISQWTNEQKQQVYRMVNSRDIQYIYELLEEGSKKPKCNFNLEYEDGFAMELLHLGKMRDSARLLCVRALLETESGKTEEAFNTLLIGLKISNHLKDEPLLISQLVRIACDGIIIECIESISNSKDVPIEKTELIINELSTHKDIEPFIKCMDGERVVWGMQGFKQILEGKISLGDTIGAENTSRTRMLSSLLLHLGKPILKKDFTCYLTVMSKIRDSSNIPYYEYVKDKILENIPKYCILTEMLIPAVDKTREQIARYQTYIDICRTGLALKLYKAKNGNYPGKLENLAPDFLNEIPVDPFSGKNLIYKKSANGFILYSLGPNMKDDGGIDARTVKWEGDYDIVWESNS